MVEMEMKLTQEIVRELLDYDPETGIMRWKARAIEWFSVEDPRGPLWAPASLEYEVCW